MKYLFTIVVLLLVPTIALGQTTQKADLEQQIRRLEETIKHAEKKLFEINSDTEGLDKAVEQFKKDGKGDLAIVYAKKREQLLSAMSEMIEAIQAYSELIAQAGAPGDVVEGLRLQLQNMRESMKSYRDTANVSLMVPGGAIQLTPYSIGQWELVQKPIQHIKSDQRVGVWRLAVGDDPMEDGYDMMGIQSPLETDDPPLPFVDGFFTAYRLGTAASEAKFQLLLVQEKDDDYIVLGQRTIHVGGLATPIRRNNNNELEAIRARPDGTFRSSVTIPEKIVKAAELQEGRAFRDSVEILVRVSPDQVKTKQNTYALSVDGDAQVHLAEDEIFIQTQFVNVTNRTLHLPELALDIYDKSSFLIGTYHASIEKQEIVVIPPGKIFLARMRVAYPEGHADKIKQQKESIRVVPRAFGTWAAQE